MAADYFQILVLHQWSSATKSLAVVVKNCNCTEEMSSLKPVSKILQQKNPNKKQTKPPNQTYRLFTVKEYREVGGKWGDRVEVTLITLALSPSQTFLQMLWWCFNLQDDDLDKCSIENISFLSSLHNLSFKLGHVWDFSSLLNFSIRECVYSDISFIWVS